METFSSDQLRFFHIPPTPFFLSLTKAEDELTVSNFQSLVSRVASAKLCERELLAEFRKQDLNGDGHISRAEAKAALQADGVQLSEEDFDDFMKTADLNGDGKVDYEGRYSS